MRGEAGDARKVDGLAEREHEVVVADLGVAPLQSLEDGDDLPLEVDGVDLRLAHPNARQEAPERRHRVAHRDAARRHLGQQRLEGEVVHLVDQLDVGDASDVPPQFPGREHAGEPAAEHEDLVPAADPPSDLLRLCAGSLALAGKNRRGFT